MLQLDLKTFLKPLSMTFSFLADFFLSYAHLSL